MVFVQIDIRIYFKLSLHLSKTAHWCHV